MEDAVQQILQRAQPCIGSSLNYLSQQQQLDSESCRAIFNFLIQLLLKLVGMKNAGKDPFETDPGKMCFLIDCLLLYGVALGFNKRFSSPRLSSVSTFAMIFFGSMAAASLTSVLLSSSFQSVPYAGYILLTTGELLYTLAVLLFKWIVQIGARTEAPLPEGATGSEILDEGNRINTA